MTPSTWHLLVSCEHASNSIPEAWQEALADAGSLLDTHAAYDIGALGIARRIHAHLGGTLVEGTHTRLLVDLNRSPHNYRRFSRFTRTLSKRQRKQLDADFHAPYWERIRSVLRARERVFHLSVHSFTPVFNGVQRRTDLALLPLTTACDVSVLAHRWKPALRERFPDLVVHINQPYTGNQDGLICQMMKIRESSSYLGIEVEISQRIVTERADDLARGLSDTLSAMISLGE